MLGNGHTIKVSGLLKGLNPAQVTEMQLGPTSAQQIFKAGAEMSLLKCGFHLRECFTYFSSQFIMLHILGVNH